MRLTSRHDDHLSRLGLDILAGYGDLSLAIDNIHRGIVRRRVLALSLTSGKGKQRYGPGFAVHQSPADYCPVLIGHHLRQVQGTPSQIVGFNVRLFFVLHRFTPFWCTPAE
jgi:hypothetical protein